MKTMKTTTKGRPDYSLGFLKTVLVGGTIAATLLGTRLLGQQAVPNNEPVMVVVPAESPQEQYALPPTYTNAGRSTQIELQPIPQAITPRIAPITRTRSSR
jgi:hypothetical protein